MAALPERMADGRAWPRITIVTPNYNYGSYLEKTIRSVLLQGYPDLEFLLLDDGSTDDSIAIAEKYRDFLAYQTGPNRGQSFRIQQGLELATGEIFNWLNSDDFLTPGSLKLVAETWRRHGCDIVIGGCDQINIDDSLYHSWSPLAARDAADFLREGANRTPQPSTFVSTALMRRAGGVRPDLKYLMDWELYFRIHSSAGAAGLKVVTRPETLSKALMHPRAKTLSYGGIIDREYEAILLEHRGHPSPGVRELISSILARRAVERKLTQAWQEGSVSEIELARLWLRSPRLFLSRFAWGALRRAVPVMARKRWAREKRRWQQIYLRAFHSLPPISLPALLGDRVPALLPAIEDDICMNPYLEQKALDDYTPLMSVASAVQPKVIVELGTAFGNAVANLARHAPAARIYTVNALPEMHDMAAFKLSVGEIGRVYRKHGLESNVTLILENTRSLDLSRHLEGKTIDLAVIDASHESDAVLNDFEKIIPFMSRSGIVFFHDTHPSGEAHLSGSYTACMRLRSRGYDIRHLPGSWWGVLHLGAERRP